MPEITTPPSVAQPSQARRPRGFVRINGQLAMPLAFEVVSKAHFAADTWAVTLEPWQQPEGFGLEWWADQAPVGCQVDIMIGFLDQTQDASDLPAEMTSLAVGVVDDVVVETVPRRWGGTLSLTGRDLTALLIDQKTSNKWPDHTSAQIVNQIAGQAGLSANVTATTTPAGQYYAGAYARLARSTSMWDLVVYLAQQEGFDAYVQGSTLYFGPQIAGSGVPFPLQISQSLYGQVYGNVKDLKLKRSLTLAQTLNVSVLSHNTASGQAIKATATRAATAKSGGGGKETAQNYVIRRPNLSQQQAQQLADQTLAELGSFERTLEAKLEGDTTLNVHTDVITLSGTGTSFDTTYYPTQVTRRYGWRGGFDMDVSAKNHPELSTS